MMRLALFVLLIAATPCAAGAQVNAGLPTGQYPGVATNTSACTGCIGQYISAFTAKGSAVSLTSPNPANIANISLTAGEWRVCSDIRFSGAATTTVNYNFASLSSTSATLDTTTGRLAAITYPGSVLYNNTDSALGSCTNFLLSGTTTIYAVAQSFFATSTANAYGGLQAWRTH